MNRISAEDPDARQNESRQQWRSLTLLVGLYLLAALTIQIGGSNALPTGMDELPTPAVTPAALGVTAAVIVILYGGLGLVGLWLARRLELPGVYAVGLTWETWVRGPLQTGLWAGALLAGVDWAAARWLGWVGFPHPSFPWSIPASVSAAIGEEILFRLFFMLLWTWVWRAALRSVLGAARARLWAAHLANGIAALAFALGHLGTAMVLFGVDSPAELPTMTWGMLLTLNGIVGLLAGRAQLRHGLVGAAGVHLGANFIWHILYGGMG